MSHVDTSPLSMYNSLSDPHLAGYFANTKMRGHLRRSGLISRRGQIVSENSYRLNMARKEHKKHVKDLLAQAIVHKTLDLERHRQVAIRQKLEEIAKLELVQRVKGERYQDKYHEALLPLLTPRKERGRGRERGRDQGGSHSADGQVSQRSVTIHTPHESDEEIIFEERITYVDDDGNPIEWPESGRGRSRTPRSREEIDARHLYSLNPAALRRYATTLARMEQTNALVSPYLMPQVPIPPSSPRTAPSRLRGHRARSTSSDKSPKRSPGRDLHRQEPPMRHQGDVHSMCQMKMKYHGWALNLARETRDPRQEVLVEQQHCGGNTLIVYRDLLVPGSTFTFTSKRHRGYPFSLTLYVDGRQDCRVSTCCEYGHSKKVRLGGKMGHFSIISMGGASPCYKCQVKRGMKGGKPAPRKQKAAKEDTGEEVIVMDTVAKEKKEKEETEEEESETDEYEDDFDDDEEDERKDEDEVQHSKKSESPRQSDRDKQSSSPVRGGAQVRGGKEEKKEEEDKRQIRGLPDELMDNSKEQKRAKVPAEKSTPTKLEAYEEDKNRKVEGYSDEEEDLEGEKSKTVIVEKNQDASPQKSNFRHPRHHRILYSAATGKEQTASSESSEVASSKPRTPSPPQTTKLTQSKVEEDRDNDYSSSESEEEVSSSSEEEATPRPKDKEGRSSDKEPVEPSVASDQNNLASVRSTTSDSTLPVSNSSSTETDTERRVASLPERPKSPVAVILMQKEEEDARRQEEAPEQERVSESHQSQPGEETGVPQPVSSARSEDSRGDSAKDSSSSSSSSSSSESETDVSTPRPAQGKPVEQETVTEAKKASSSETETETDRSEPPLTQTSAQKVERKPSSSSDSSSDSSGSETERSDKVGSSPSAQKAETKEVKKAKKSSSSSSSSYETTESERERSEKAAAPDSTLKPVEDGGKKSDHSDTSSSSSSSGSGSETERSEKTEPKTSPAIAEENSLKTSESSQNDKSERPGTAAMTAEPAESSAKDAQPPAATDQTQAAESEPAANIAQEGQTSGGLPHESSEKKFEGSATETADSSSDSSSDSSTSSSSSDDESESEGELIVQSDTDRSRQADTDRSQQANTEQSQQADTSQSKQPDVDQSKQVEGIRSEPEGTSETQQETQDTAGGSGGSDAVPDTDPASKQGQTTPPQSPPGSPRQGQQPLVPAVVVIPNTPDPSDRQGDDSIPPRPKTSRGLPEQFQYSPKHESQTDDEKQGRHMSESEPETNHGGNDPDNVADNDSANWKGSLEYIGAPEQTTHSGSITPLLDGAEDININNINLTKSQWVELLQAVEMKDTIHTLSVFNANVGMDEIASLLQSLAKSPAKPTVLNLNYNTLGPASMDSLVDIIKIKPTIEMLLLQGNPIGNKGLQTLVDGLLDIEYEAQAYKKKEMESHGGVPIMLPRGRFCQLKELDVAEACITDDGMVDIALYLESNLDLETLSLSFSPDVTLSGWSKLGSALSKNRKLRTLTLEHNKIGDEGIVAIAEGLKNNTSLRSLDLANTRIGESGAQAIVDLLKRNTTLLNITLTPGNSIPESTMAEIQRYLSLNQASAYSNN